MRKFFTRLVTVIFLSGVIVWILIVDISILFPGNTILPALAPITGWPVDFVAKPKVPTEIKTFDDFLYSDGFYGIIVAGAFVAVFGLFSVTKGRNLLEKYLLLQAFALPRQRDHWGKVTDVTTHQPVPFAVLRLIKIEDGKERFIRQTVADSDGRYRLYTTKNYGNVILEVKADNYKEYRDLMHKSFLEGDNVLRVNIRLTPATDDRHSLGFYARYQPQILGFLTRFTVGMSMITFAHALYSLIFHFNIISIGDMIFYGFAAPWNIFVLWERRKFAPGRFLNAASKKPIAFVNVQLLLQAGKRLSLLSDKTGIVKFDVENGDYKLKVTHPGYKLDKGKDNYIDIKISEDGYLSKDVYLHPLGGAAQDSAMMLNPFV